MTQQEREALTVISPVFCFFPAIGDLFMRVSVSQEEPRYFWPVEEGGFEEVTAEEGARRVLANMGPSV